MTLKEVALEFRIKYDINREKEVRGGGGMAVGWGGERI